MDKIIIVAYGLLLLLGGYFGFKKGSTVSLAMGLVSGALILLGAWWMSLNPKGAWILLSCISGLLAVTFLIRLLKTQAFMPSGMLLTVSLLFLVFCLSHLLHA